MRAGSCQSLPVLLANRVAVVSGIGPGMGRDVSLALAREGADVVLAARSAERLDAVAAEVRTLGRKALPIATDVADAEQCRRLAARAVEELGRIDVLVNNAFAAGPFDPIETASFDDWRRVFEVNLFGSLELSRAVLSSMKARGGSIVMIGSMSMRLIEPRFGGYAASKAALLTAARTLAREVGAYRIRVNSVVPGYIWGPALAGYFRRLAAERSTTPEAVYEQIAARSALGYIPSSEEIAGAVVFFASELSRPITGQALDVNCGHHLE